MLPEVLGWVLSAARPMSSRAKVRKSNSRRKPDCWFEWTTRSRCPEMALLTTTLPAVANLLHKHDALGPGGTSHRWCGASPVVNQHSSRSLNLYSLERSFY